MSQTADAPTAALTPTEQPQPRLVEERDNVRETLETIAFVVFLVLLLKGFVAEAFVIPTGSMATTLFGEHTSCICDRCKYAFTSNNQLNTQAHAIDMVECPNCHYRMFLRGKAGAPEGGDKVLVLKPQYDLKPPRRHDVFVFKFPGEPYYLTNGPNRMGFAPEDGLKRQGGPQEDFGPKNFIKRLWGLPKEKLGIWQGDVYLVVPGADGKEKLEIIRRDPRLLLAMRRIVNNNDYLAEQAQPPVRSRWTSGKDWQTEPGTPGWDSADGGKAFTSTGSGQTQWLRYRHAVVPGDGPRADQEMNRPEPARAGSPQPELITDFLEYNEDRDQHHHWVGDLMLDAEVDVLDNKGEVILELNRGLDCYRAIINLSKGEVSLEMFRDGAAVPLGQATAPFAPTPLGHHRVRFADFDQRLTLWVDERLPFGDGIVLPPPPKSEVGPRLADLFPVSIGAKDARVKVTKLQVWRDIYYTQVGLYDLQVGKDVITISDEQVQKWVDEERNRRAMGNGPLFPKQLALHAVRPKAWDVFFNGSTFSGGTTVRMDEPTFYPVQHPKYHPSDRFEEDEYFALGDNSVQSKDSRFWGQVPRRLLMGKAVWVYWPWDRWMLIR